MLRSELNEIIRAGEDFIASFGFKMPPFAAWSPADWRANKDRAGAIIGPRLGWDITDYGFGSFTKKGLLLFTVRNGTLDNLKRGTGMVYAEKIMISRANQLTPMHWHKMKTEDIIVRGGAPLEVKLYNVAADGVSIDRERPVTVMCDGLARTVAPGGTVVLEPGESITLEPGQAHAFWGKDGDCLIGEVSTVNDDETDNYFLEPVSRFPSVEEEAEAYRLIVPDYKGL
ncbi:D-lyxose/D-mannose family sugar isomerase [Methyloraptor flagellatus]|uniref:D-lyxose ketol-isomerase n=1 Tax=Methyloraptor flagellatus TaxID=3162530 RepID=A0AAU7X4Q7_9HYPH